MLLVTKEEEGIKKRQNIDLQPPPAAVVHLWVSLGDVDVGRRGGG